MLSVLITIVHVIVCAVLIVGSAAATRQERRYRSHFWRHGKPDRVRSARHSHCVLPRDDLVRHHLYDYVYGADLYDQLAWIVFSNGQGPDTGGDPKK